MFRPILYLLLAFIVAVPAFAQQATTTLPLIRVEGNKFVDDRGNTVVFRGVSIGDPDKLEKQGHWNREIFLAAKDWGVNIVRLPVHPSAWRERGEANYLKLLDQAVGWASERGMYVIVDWHSIGNLETEVFSNPMYNTTKTETFRFWKTMAERYAKNSAVPFFELFNEPTSSGGKFGKITWEGHKQLMEELIYMIRAHDTSKIALVAGFNWAYDLTEAGAKPIDFPNVAYVTHPYPQKRNTPWEAQWEKDWGFMADKYPVIATELGFVKADERGAHVPVIGDETYGEAIVGYFEKKGISWTAWVFDPNWAPPMFEDWNFTPTRQGRFFRDKMRQLNRK